MRPALALLILLAALLAWGQRDRFAPPPSSPTWDYRALVPAEIGPGVYQQVEWHQVTALGDQGWELTSVTPFVIRNDEREYRREGATRIVTQNYLAYYFKRQRQPPR